MNRTAVTLYVFSGVHQGARIALTPGTWVLGSSDECDLVLFGLAERHAELRVETGTGEPGKPRVLVTVQPLDGPLLREGEVCTGEQTLPPGEAWFLGETCLVWNLPDVHQEAVSLDMRDLSRTEAGTDAQDAPKKAPKNAAEDGDGTPDHTSGTRGRGDAETGTPGTGDVPGDDPERRVSTGACDPHVPHDGSPGIVGKEKSGPGYRRLISLVLLSVLLMLLSVAVTTGPGPEDYPGIVADLLEQAGIHGCRVSPRWNGVEVRGAVADAGQRERLSRLVENLSFPVYLEIPVDEDLIRAVQNSLRMRGFSPVVSVHRENGQVTCRIRAFMRDALVEKDAFRLLENDVPSPPLKERVIVHADDVRPVLEAGLHSLGLDQVTPTYLPGRIVLPVSDSRVTRLKTDLSARFGVPLFGEAPGDLSPVRQPSGAKNLSVQAVAQEEEKPDAARPVRLGITITGVFTAPLRFVTTADGRCLFVGAVLPNGLVIEKITQTQLTLRSRTTLIDYPLADEAYQGAP